MKDNDQVLATFIESFFTKNILFTEDLLAEGKPAINTVLKANKYHLFTSFQGYYIFSFSQLTKLLGIYLLEEKEALRRKVFSNEVTKSLCIEFTDGNSERIQAAKAMGLNTYTNYTKSIRVLTPRALDYLLGSTTILGSIGEKYRKELVESLVGLTKTSQGREKIVQLIK